MALAMVAVFCRRNWTGVYRLTWIALKCLGWIVLSGIDLDVRLGGAMQRLKDLFCFHDFLDYSKDIFGMFFNNSPLRGPAWEWLNRKPA